MSNENIGEQAWLDLTVANATEVKNFYQQVVGWQAENISMGKYDDYAMKSPTTGDTISGICHAQGMNTNMPATWLPYFLVANLEQSLHHVVSLGGELLTEIKTMGGADRCVVIKDPAGASCVLYHKG